MNRFSRVLITIPTFNEEIVIAKTIHDLSEEVIKSLPECKVTIEIADNGSTDKTREMVQACSFQNDERITSQLLLLHEKGKGMAIRKSWEKHVKDFDVLVFMDADLAADVTALPDLINPILQNDFDVVCGSRLVPGAKVERVFFRELTSRVYGRLQQMILHLPVKDAQCGFKAISTVKASEILPLCQEETWLLDSELLALAQMKKFRIKEIPVLWVEFRDQRRKSTVKVWKHAWSFLLGLAKIRQRIHNMKG